MTCGAVCGCGAQGVGAVLGSLGRPPRRQMHLVDRVDDSRSADGQQIQVRLEGGPPLRDARGWHAHVAAIALKWKSDVTNGALAGGPTFSGRELFRTFQSIFLEDGSGWQYWVALHGRDLDDDASIRMRRRMFALPSDVAAASSVAQSIVLYAPLSIYDADGVPSVRGVIPLASLRQRGASALRMQVPASGQLTDPGSGASVSGTSGRLVSDLEVWLDIIYLPAVVVDAPWSLEAYALTERNGVVRHCERRHEYVYIREDPGTTVDEDGVTIQVEGHVTAAGLTSAQWDQQHEIQRRSDPDADITELDAIATVGPVPYTTRERAHMAEGTVAFSYSTRVRNETRYLHRSIAAHSLDRLRRCREAAGIAPGQQPRAVTPRLTAVPLAVAPHEPALITDARVTVPSTTVEVRDDELI